MNDNKTELAVQTNAIQEEIKKFIFWNYSTEISEVQMAMAIKLCQEYNLSPLRREIHFLPFKNSKWQSDLQPVIAYTEYLKKAQMTGHLDWWKYDIGVYEWEKKDMWCKVTIYRKDWKYPLEHTVWFSEVVQKTSEWKPNKNRTNKPKFMIMKVAVAQAMRLAFPEDLGAMPYEEAEAWNVIDGKTETKATVQWVVEEIDYNNEEESTLPRADDPKAVQLRQSVKLNELQSAWTKKMWLNNNELLTRRFNIKYQKVSISDLTDDEIGEMKFTIQDYDYNHLEQFIKNLEPGDV